MDCSLSHTIAQQATAIMNCNAFTDSDCTVNFFDDIFVKGNISILLHDVHICLLLKDIAIYILDSNFKLICGISFLLFVNSFLSKMTFQKRVFVFVEIFGPVWREKKNAKTKTRFRFFFVVPIGPTSLGCKTQKK